MSIAVDHLGDELDRLIDRFRNEYDMTYAEAVGVLQMKIHALCREDEESEEES